MAEQKATQSRAAAEVLAKQQHMPVREFLNQEPTRTELLEGLVEKKGEGNEFTVLKELLKSKGPFSSEHMKHMKIDHGMHKSTVSEAVKETNEYLSEFCKKSEAATPLKNKRIEIRVRHKKGRGGLFIGYHFYCYNTKTKKECHGPKTKELFEDIWKKFFNAKLRKKLKEETQRSLSEKLDDPDDYKPLDMEIGTVPEKPRQDGTATEFEQPNTYDHNRVWKPFDAESLLEPKGLYILSSDCGTGKTTLLRHLQLEILELPDFIPIFLDAREIEGWGCELEPDRLSKLIEKLAKKLAENSSLKVHEDRFVGFLAEAFKEDIVLLIDGLDQISGGENRYEHLANYILDLSKNVIIASRPSAVVALEGQGDVSFLRLKPFSRSIQKLYFGEQHYKRARELSVNCPDLIAIPMLAYMVRTLIEKGKDKDVKNRADLYKEFINHILTKYRHGGVQLPTALQSPIRLKLQKISYKALAMKKYHTQKIPLEFCYEKGLLSNDLRKGPAEAEVLTKSGLVNLVNDSLYFTHQSFQEYLAAEWARKNEPRIKRILDQMWNPKWKETVKFLAGMFGEDFIKRIYSPGCKDNCIHSRLFLAAECCGELGEVCELEQDIFNQLTELVGDPVIKKDVLFSLNKLNIPEGIDFLISMAVDSITRDQYDSLLAICNSLAVQIVCLTQRKIQPKHISRFINIVKSGKEQWSMLGSCPRRLIEFPTAVDATK